MDLHALGWDDEFARAFQPYAAQGLTPARVAIEFNRFFRIYAEAGEFTVVTAGRLRHTAANRSELPAVGDWVAVRMEPTTGSKASTQASGSIQGVLPRRSRFSRKVAGRVVVEQVVSANVDTVFLVSGLDLDFNLRRIERYLVMAWESGAQPVLLLNKADLVDDALDLVHEVEAIAAGAPVHALSSKYQQGLEIVRSYIKPGRTIALLGSSGVGKSTLINSLLGEDRYLTAEVRANDNQGRHTTTNRQLVLLPGGGLLIDTPGMRELQLWDADDGAGQSFTDIDEIAANCRFANCSHGDEPGCAVQASIEAGELEPERVASYFKIQGELDHLTEQQTIQARQESKRQIKVVTRSVERLQRGR